jgi:MFS family permease
MHVEVDPRPAVQEPAPPAATGWRRLVPRLLRESPPFRALWSAHTVSLFGDQISLLAIPLVAVLALGAGPTQMGLLTAAGLVPNLLFSLHAGAWVDRHGHRRRVMIVSDLGRAALLATIPVAAAFDLLTLWQLWVVAFLTGTLSVLFYVSDTAVFAAILPRDRYLEGNSLIFGSRAFSFVSGPSLGGFLVQVLTAPFALAVDALSFLASALFLRGATVAEPPPAAPAKGHVAEGARFIRRSPIVLASLLGGATVNLFNLMFLALFVLYAVTGLHLSPGTLGAVLGAGAVGTLIGAAVAAPLGRRIGVGPAYILGTVLFTAPAILVPLADGSRGTVLALLFLYRILTGLGLMILDINVVSILTAAVPSSLRSRVTGAYMVVNYGVRPVGSVLGGALGAALGLRPTLLVAAVGGVAGVLWLLPSPLRRLRRLPEPEEPEPAAA